MATDQTLFKYGQEHAPKPDGETETLRQFPRSLITEVADARIKDVTKIVIMGRVG